jgi:hypothetical protein
MNAFVNENTSWLTVHPQLDINPLKLNCFLGFFCLKCDVFRGAGEVIAAFNAAFFTARRNVSLMISDQ